jgi:DNA-binding CsgD family transcriptional regulator/tetratricopeptide (TPR) repeat protein
MSCAELASEIERDLDVLTTNVRNVPEKHRSMRAAFEHSWKLLTEDEQAAFRRLSVFRGGFRREAGAEVSGASLLTLSALVDKSLLRMGGTGRYDLHELMRQYAEEQLDITGEAGTTRDAHSAYYLDFVAQREADIQGRRQLAALKEMAEDFENIRAAWSQALERKTEEAIDRAITALCCYGEFVSRNWQIEQLLAQAAAVFDPASGYPPGTLWARITARLLWISLLGSGEHNDIAPARIDRCLELADAFHDDDVASWSWTVKGMIHFWQDDYQNALLAFQQSLNYAYKLEDNYSIAARLKWIGSCYRELFQYALSLDCLQQSVRMHLEIGDKHGAGFALSQLAATLYRVGHHVEAERTLEQAIALHREIACGKGIAWSMWIKSHWTMNSGDLETAESLAQTVLKMSIDLNHWDTKHHALSTLAYLSLLNEDYLQGQQYFDSMLSVKKDIPPPAFLLAIAAFGLKDFERCRTHLGEHILSVLKASRPTDLIFLVVAALLSAREGSTERAVELVGLAFSHPASHPKLLEKWPLLTRLRTNLETELGLEGYRTAWEYGKSLDPYTVSRDLLSTLNIPTDLNPVAPAVRHPDSLSERELEILRLIAEGLNSREIAERLILSVGTIRWYLKNIYGKIDAHSRSEAIARARELNLLA